MAFGGPSLGTGAAARGSSLTDGDRGSGPLGPRRLREDAQAVARVSPTTWLGLFIARFTEEGAEAQRD